MMIENNELINREYQIRKYQQIQIYNALSLLKEIVINKSTSQISKYSSNLFYNTPFYISTEEIVTSIVENPIELKKIKYKIVDKAIELAKKIVKETGFNEMYTAFEEAANCLYIYIPVSNFSLEITKKFSTIEKRMMNELQIITVEVVPLFKDEFVGKNMEHHKLNG